MGAPDRSMAAVPKSLSFNTIWSNETGTRAREKDAMPGG
jgi:hypothetical protein